jgi:hypothetical protein
VTTAPLLNHHLKTNPYYNVEIRDNNDCLLGGNKMGDPISKALYTTYLTGKKPNKTVDTKPSNRIPKRTTKMKMTKQQQIDKMNEFMELMGVAHLYDFWSDGLISTEQLLTPDESFKEITE